MNSLLVGTNKTFDIDFSSSVLVIDDGPVIDALKLPSKKTATHFDLSKHGLNPLRGMNYKRAKDFVSIMDAVYPEGASTLTRKNSNFVLLNALVGKVDRLDNLLQPDPKDPAAQDAHQKIATLLISPVLKTVFCKSEHLSLRGVVLARLDRAVIGDFDAFVLASFLVSQFKGRLVIPDFGFYGREFHMALIRQNRLTAGLNFLTEAPPALRQALLTIPQKIASGTTYEDAVVLANYEGLRPDPSIADNPYNRFIDQAMGLV